MVTRALEGIPFGQPACIICKKAEPTLYKRFCAPCFEETKAKFRETWKDVPFENEKAFEELVLSFFVDEIEENGERRLETLLEEPNEGNEEEPTTAEDRLNERLQDLAQARGDLRKPKEGRE